MNISNLYPESLWKYFYEITQIPRPSKKEHKIIEYINKFGKKYNLETISDEAGNIIIRKPPYKGMKNRKGVILQSHLDMVPQKNSDKVHDFDNDPIETIVDGDWVRANGTTLGADNGVGVAAILSVLSSDNIVHGPIEALLTIDEETGMTGALALQKGILRGDILMNLDSEDEGELYVGCAGGIDISIKKRYQQDKVPEGSVAYRIVVKGLSGGHSGVDIALGRANSNKLMFRLLANLESESEFDIRIAEVSGGDVRNAIPRESYAVVVLSAKKSVEFEKIIKSYQNIYKAEFSDTDQELSLAFNKVALPGKVMSIEDQYGIIRALFACPSGIQRMSRSMEGLVETSNNLAVVKCGGGLLEVYNLARSSVDSAREATAEQIRALFQMIDAEVSFSGRYPGWKPDMQSEILKIMKGVHYDLFGKHPDVKAIHAGLECGIIGGIYSNLDMISFGPTIRYPHSPDEKVNIESVGKFWEFLVESLKHIPKI